MTSSPYIQAAYDEEFEIEDQDLFEYDPAETFEVLREIDPFQGRSALTPAQVIATLKEFEK